MHGHHKLAFHASPPPGVDELSFDVFRALMRTVKLNGRLLMRVMARRGGHPGQAGCLWAIGAREGISQRELATMVQLSPPTVTTMLQKMERAGLVERRADASDQRITRIHLTDAGRAMDRDLRVAHGTYLSETIGTMSATDRRDLVRLLRKLGDNIEAALAAAESASADGGEAR